MCIQKYTLLQIRDYHCKKDLAFNKPRQMV